MRRSALTVFCALAVIAVSCATPRHPRLAGTKFPGLWTPAQKMTTVKEKIPGHGKWVMIVNEGEGRAYTPEDGKVSGYDFDDPARLTASGEVFDSRAMTAAHRSLPLHTMVRVTRVDEPQSIVVRINDRATEVDGRVLEVTPKAAQELGLDKVGAAPCRVEVLRYPIVDTAGMPGPEPTY